MYTYICIYVYTHTHTHTHSHTHTCTCTASTPEGCCFSFSVFQIRCVGAFEIKEEKTKGGKTKGCASKTIAKEKAHSKAKAAKPA